MAGAAWATGLRQVGMALGPWPGMGWGGGVAGLLGKVGGGRQAGWVDGWSSE